MGCTNLHASGRRTFATIVLMKTFPDSAQCRWDGGIGVSSGMSCPNDIGLLYTNRAVCLQLAHLPFVNVPSRSLALYHCPSALCSLLAPHTTTSVFSRTLIVGLPDPPRIHELPEPGTEESRNQRLSSGSLRRTPRWQVYTPIEQ